jgi:hypothetical protein
MIEEQRARIVADLVHVFLTNNKITLEELMTALSILLNKESRLKFKQGAKEEL